MANHFFRFKQFTVNQEHCAMKVCTDSCLFGAWAAQTATNGFLPANTVLDIGTGTGLLSLQLAQQLPTATIDSIEIDESAAAQAAGNFKQSPWQNRLTVQHTRLQDFFPRYTYDFIISNPPFYNNDLQSIDPSRNVALHHTGLTFSELIQAIKRLLSHDGNFAVLLPFHRTEEFIQLAQFNGFYLHLKTIVRQSPRHSPFRSMLLFGTHNINYSEADICIKAEGNDYSEDFTCLLKNYYLYL